MQQNKYFLGILSENLECALTEGLISLALIIINKEFIGTRLEIFYSFQDSFCTPTAETIPPVHRSSKNTPKCIFAIESHLQFLQLQSNHPL